MAKLFIVFAAQNPMIPLSTITDNSVSPDVTTPPSTNKSVQSKNTKRTTSAMTTARTTFAATTIISAEGTKSNI